MELTTIETEELQVLTFQIDDAVYGINMKNVKVVRNYKTITPLPYDLPSYVKGITVLKRKIVPVIDLRLRFGIPASKLINKEGVMVIVQDKYSLGIIVDSIMEILIFSKKDIESCTNGSFRHHPEGILGIAKRGNDDYVIILDLMKVIPEKYMSSFV